MRAGKVSMRANCVSLLTCSCEVMRTHPRPSDGGREVRGEREARHARKDLGANAHSRERKMSQATALGARVPQAELNRFAGKCGARPARKNKKERRLL